MVSACYNHVYNHQNMYFEQQLPSGVETEEPKSAPGHVQKPEPPAHSRMSWGQLQLLNTSTDLSRVNATLQKQNNPYETLDDQ